MPPYRFQAICDKVDFTIPEVELPERYEDHPLALKELVGRVEARIWIEAATRNLTIRCFTCDERAKSCLHHPALAATPDDGGLPIYVDFATPVCGDPSCAHVAQREFEACMSESDRRCGHEPTKQLEFCQCCSAQRPNLLRCSRCKSVYYCDAECQKKDWKNHKGACGGRR